MKNKLYTAESLKWKRVNKLIYTTKTIGGTYRIQHRAGTVEWMLFYCGENIKLCASIEKAMEVAEAHYGEELEQYLKVARVCICEPISGTRTVIGCPVHDKQPEEEEEEQKMVEENKETELLVCDDCESRSTDSDLLSRFNNGLKAIRCPECGVGTMYDEDKEVQKELSPEETRKAVEENLDKAVLGAIKQARAGDRMVVIVATRTQLDIKFYGEVWPDEKKKEVHPG